MRVGIAQISPVFLDRDATIAKIVEWIGTAKGAGCELVAFGETLIPGYPVWSGVTGGARFNDDYQKQLHAIYLDQAVQIDRPSAGSGDLADVTVAAREHSIAVVLGVVERAIDRGGYTAYCSRVMIDSDGAILSVHRKLMPTYEERLSWGIGDGAGLVVHRVGEFTVGGLNCWENWMPLARAALYAQGLDVHVMLWPGCVRNTELTTRFIARESRSYVLSASAILRAQDIGASVPNRDAIIDGDELIHNGGSAIAGPDGEWIVPPTAATETLITADLDPARVREERQNFDPSGHYARPDVLQLRVDRRRQRTAIFDD